MDAIADIASYVAIGRPASKFDLRNWFEMIPTLTWLAVLIMALVADVGDAGVHLKLRGDAGEEGKLFLWNEKGLNTLAGQTISMGILLVSGSILSVIERMTTGMIASGALLIRNLCQISFILIAVLSFSLVSGLPTLLAVDEKGREGTLDDIMVNLISGLQMLSVVLFLRRELPTINVSADIHDMVGYSAIKAEAKSGLPTVAAAKGDDIAINFDRKIHSYY